MTDIPKLFLTHATAKREISGYTAGVPTKVYVQEMKGEARRAIYKYNNMDANAGYHVYSNLDVLKQDFDLEEMELSVRR